MEGMAMGKKGKTMNWYEKLPDRLAKGLRYLSIPPVIVTLLVLVLKQQAPGLFHSTAEIMVTLAGLAFCPVLAYPISLLCPGLRRRGREFQRDLAFILSAAGYAAAWLCGIIFFHNPLLTGVYSIYLLSVILLLVANKVLHKRASGHACSVTGPLVLCCWFLGADWLIPCSVLYALIFWASLKTRRHTKRELIYGTMICLLSAFLVWCILCH